MKFIISEHNKGSNVFSVDLRQEIEQAITSITVKPANGVSQTLRNQFLTCIRSLGWSSELSIARGSAITITSAKRDVGLCLQVGNVARSYADIMKLQTLYFDASISAGAIIVPSTDIAKKLGVNLAQADRLIRELKIFKKVYTLPTLIFSLEEEL